jgi:hypothetical protein
LPSADEPKPGSFTAIAQVGSRLLDDARASWLCQLQLDLARIS